MQSCFEQGEVDAISLIGKTKKGSNKGLKKKDGTNTWKKELRKVFYKRLKKLKYNFILLDSYRKKRKSCYNFARSQSRDSIYPLNH